MIAVETRNGISRQTVLSLLLGPALDLPAGSDRPVLDAAAREDVLDWARRQPPGALALSDAPLHPATLRDLLPVLAERRKRLDDALAAWARDGTWVIGRDDPAYPKRLKRRLGSDFPPLLFGRGEAGLAGRGGVAVLHGSAADPAAAPALRAALAESMLSLISLPPGEDWIRIERIASPDAGASLRLSPPEASSGDRAGLEACCYALADTVVAIGVGRDDPAWDGLAALVAQDRQPVWVLGAGGDAGLLVRAGAHVVPPDLLAGGANALLLPPARPRTDTAGPGNPSRTTLRPSLVSGFAEQQAGFETAMPPARAPSLRLVETGGRTVPAPRMSTGDPTLFELFAVRLAALLSHGPLGAGRIAEAMDLTRAQVDAWLLRAEAAGLVVGEARTRLFKRPDA